MINVADNFSYLGQKPLDGRIKYNTLAEMAAMPDSTLYDGCIAYCKGEDKNYQWKSTNTVDSTTGKWRELEAGGGSTEATVLTGTLTTSGWSNKSQTVTITGMTASTNGVIGLLNTATDAQIAAAATAKIKPTAQGTNSVTFTCEAVPAVDIPFGVVIGGGSSALVIDSVIDSLSENAVQNKVIADALDKKYSEDDTAFTALADGDYIPVYDTSTSTKKKTLWSNIKALLGSVFQPIINYSTSEQNTGLKWIDGKTIYQKTFNCGKLSIPSKTVNHNISNFGTLIFVYGAGNYQNGVTQVSIPFTTGEEGTLVTSSVQVNVNSTAIVFHTSNTAATDMQVYITILYTKK